MQEGGIVSLNYVSEGADQAFKPVAGKVSQELRCEEQTQGTEVLACWDK